MQKRKLKHEIRNFNLVIVHQWQGNVQKRVIYKQSCCLLMFMYASRISYNEIGIEAFEAFIKLCCLRLPAKIALYLL